MDTNECVICLNNISKNEEFILTCCKNNVHIYCLNSWVKKNITNKNIGKCFICSQENSIIENTVSYNKNSHNNNETIIDYTNTITNSNNNINNDIVLYNTNHILTITYNIENRLYYLYISIKLIFLVSVSCLLIFVLYFII